MSAMRPLTPSRLHGNRVGHRGYIASRAVRGQLMPQQVQNLVVRDYARRKGLTYKLSATEYGMAGNYMMLESVLEELDGLEGIILFSLFMLPQRPERRHAIYRRVLEAGGTLHAALEDLAVTCETDIARIEDILLLEPFTTHRSLVGP
jgi:sporadic carbohydrate cluster protein (TIGR04323 family)